MDPNESTKVHGDMAVQRDHKLALGREGRFHDHFERFAPVKDETMDEYDLVEVQKDKVMRIVRIGILALLAAFIIGMLIWKIIEEPHLFSLFLQK